MDTRPRVIRIFKTNAEVSHGLTNNQKEKTMSKTTEKPATEAVDLNRLVRHWDSREESLEAEYERHKGERQMESIISGQLLEIEKMRRVFLPKAEDRRERSELF